ncbi:DUF5011 domain-containing protein, partial [Patescibacteria group bacterium]|nr:DUF5011 domain-containing protein [Patescibacteria group bacterium]
LALTDGSLTNNGWTFRAAGNSLFIATSSPTTFATSTTAVLSFDANGTPTFAKAIPVASGGTGATTLTTNGVLYGAGTGAIVATGQGAANSILVANAGAPSFSAAPTIGTSVTTPIVIGGSAVGSSLSLRPTSGAGVGAELIQLQLGNNGNVTAATIRQSGFGIGTTSPRWALTVASSTRPQLALTDGSLTNDGWTFRAAGNSLFIATSSPTTFATSTIPSLTIDTNGRVGIASSTPGSLLSLGNTNGINFSTATSTFSSTGGINLASGCFAINGTCVGGGGGGLTGTGSANKLAYWSSSTNLTFSDRLHIDPTNVRFGVGTTSPAAKLAVHAFAGETLTNNMLFSVASSTASATTTLFTVYNSGQTVLGEPGSTANQDATIQLGADNFAFALGYAASDSSFRIASSTTLATTTTLFSIQKSGNVGIGTSTPWRTLSINGTGAWSGLSAAASGNVVVCINATTKNLFEGSSATTCTPSSIQFKEQVQNSNAGLATLSRMRPVRFYFKDQGDPAEQLGFIAEELFEIDPRLVQLGPNGQPSSLKLDNIVSLIANSVRQLATVYAVTNPGESTMPAILSSYIGTSSPAIAIGTDGRVVLSGTIDARSLKLVDSAQPEVAWKLAVQNGALTIVSSTTATSSLRIEAGAQSTTTLAGALQTLANAAFTEGVALTKLVSGQVVAQIGIFDKIFAKEVHTEKLCIGTTCVTEEELLELLGGSAPAAGASQGASQGASSGADAPPTISIQGNNPAVLEVGETYADLGALVTDDNDPNIGITTLLDGTEVTAVAIDTSAPGNYSITYRAIDSAGNTTEAVRTVEVRASGIAQADPAPEPAPTPDPNPDPGL